jgi:hypothetical protein
VTLVVVRWPWQVSGLIAPTTSSPSATDLAIFPVV